MIIKIKSGSHKTQEKDKNAGEAVKMSTETKGKAVEAALANIEKKFG
jgi:hypothetical protein